MELSFLFAIFNQRRFCHYSILFSNGVPYSVINKSKVAAYVITDAYCGKQTKRFLDKGSRIDQNENFCGNE